MTDWQSQFVRFGVAGAIGFFVDAGVLYAALGLGAGPHLGRVISFLCAAFVTWRINRRYTFTADTGRSAWREWIEYLLAMSAGGAVNYVAYAIALHFLHDGAYRPGTAVAIGSLAGMCVNFAAAKFWAFRT
ncbi:GtrA family protein [Caballeronia sp. LZ025]|uniref:GtrA family protein n=1 Tax=Caballeronia sp. LZ025 TaxID=3038562 RepID=UPI002862F467|nr:GtrA family protein [Caballeronia sp. LZ025]MDR5732650.1 GtrA family protein [Caballeronia sp. LZ025]